ncbi:MAG: restriction endonuclease subunit S [Candidatus Limisoma sp.]|nr:restriction endonuclease subunit S [Candidatus Limisoma sp.]
MNEPKIRFEGFCEEWNLCLLNDCLEICTKKNCNNLYDKTDVLSVSDEFGVVNQIKHLGRSYAGKSVSGYKIINPGQIVYTKSPLRNKPFGIIKVNNFQPGIVSVLYAVYNTKDNVLPFFIDKYFEPNYRINHYLLPLVSKGAKNTMNISDETALQGYIIIPNSKDEQNNICDFFDSLDAQIKATGERVASLKQIKAASLQAMFPQEGETTPRLRFKGFTEDWQLVTLGELFKERTERNRNGELLSVTMNNGIIKASENGRSDNSSEDKSNYKVVKVGDIAYNSMRMWQGASGCSQYEGIVSPAYTVIAPNENICSAFFSYYFKTSDVIKIFRLHSQGLTKDTWNLKYPMFSLIELYFPNNPIEQQKIADYFTNLDRQISLQGQRLEKLKQIKAACLDKMFV